MSKQARICVELKVKEVERLRGLVRRGVHVRDIVRRYRVDGLANQLEDRPRPGAEARLDEGEEQRIIAMICADPREGDPRWTVRLITAEAIQRKIVPTIGREATRLLLERHGLKPWREENVVRRRTQR